MDPKTTDVCVNTSTVGGPRKLAFSVENILDPNKFTGRNKDGQCDSYSPNDRNNNNQTIYHNGSYGPGAGEDDLSQAGELNRFIFILE